MRKELEKMTKSEMADELSVARSRLDFLAENTKEINAEFDNLRKTIKDGSKELEDAKGSINSYQHWIGSLRRILRGYSSEKSKVESLRDLMGIFPEPQRFFCPEEHHRRFLD